MERVSIVAMWLEIPFYFHPLIAPQQPSPNYGSEVFDMGSRCYITNVLPYDPSLIFDSIGPRSGSLNDLQSMSYCG